MVLNRRTRKSLDQCRVRARRPVPDLLGGRRDREPPFVRASAVCSSGPRARPGARFRPSWECPSPASMPGASRRRSTSDPRRARTSPGLLEVQGRMDCYQRKHHCGALRPQNDTSVAAPSREAKFAGVMALADADDGARRRLSPGSAAVPSAGSPAWSRARKWRLSGRACRRAGA